MSYGIRTTHDRERHRLRLYRSTVDLLDEETLVWYERILALGGAVSGRSVAVADALIRALKETTFDSKIVWLLPLLGDDILAATVPLRDSLEVGAATNSGFVDADFDETVGLANPSESAKRLDTLIRPSQLGTTNNGGLGWWEANWGTGTGVEPMGCYNTANTNRYVLDLRSTLQAFRWGLPGNGAGPSTSTSNGHYYGQRASSTERKLFKDGVQIGLTNTTADSTAGADNKSIWVMGNNGPSATYWDGTCAVAYLTNGALSDSEVAALHTLLQNYLITPMSR